MHILIVPSWYPKLSNDVSGSFFREQAIALKKNSNCKVGVIYPQRRSMCDWRAVFTGKYGAEEEVDNGVVTLRKHGLKCIPVFPHGSALQWLYDGLKIYQLYVNRHGVPDIIHAHAVIYGGVLAHKIQQRFSIPYVITEHSTIYARSLVSRWQKKLAYDAVKHASRRFAVSKNFWELLQKYFGNEAGVWEPLPNIVHHSFCDYPLNNFRPKNDKFVFICIALLTEKKAVHDLLAAFAKVFAGDNTTNLVIGGEGDERRRLETMVGELQIGEQVKFLGALSRKQVLLQIADSDALVLPSHFETFGVVVVEALALGKPVIVTRCGGPESIVCAQDGVIVPTGDIEAMACEMKKMRKNSDNYDSHSIRQSCISRFSEEAVSGRLVAEYQNILDSKTVEM
jgi:glycosyltransferase involved in cell wall biosynthesis